MNLHIRQFPDMAPKLRLEHCLLVSHGQKPPAIVHLDNHCGKWEEGRLLNLGRTKASQPASFARNSW
ncbi:hypothetical protein GE21DRAFT_1308052 [Neurospora crassa]|nr:hypothetical protein GE21DRAFT_1308052 [Neurospora crassa]